MNLIWPPNGEGTQKTQTMREFTILHTLDVQDFRVLGLRGGGGGFYKFEVSGFSDSRVVRY